MTDGPTFVVVAGEPSGDWIAAKVVTALYQKIPDAAFIGIGGDAMRDAGVVLTEHISRLSALGPVDSLKSLPRWASAWTELRQQCRRHLIAAAILVDCPEVNLRLARALKADGIPVLQYMGPKIWAWRKDRLGLLRARTDWVALGFAFEKALYDAAGVRASFVGHPLLDASEAPSRHMVRRKLHAPEGANVVALLPGSRKSEISYHGEAMISAGVRLLKDRMVPVFAPYGLSPDDPWCQKARSLGCLCWHEPVTHLLPACDAAVAASGTVTLEVALAGVPMVTVYKMNAVNYWLGTKLLHIPYIGLPNWIAGRLVVPELLQDHVTPGTLYQQVHRLVTPSETRRQKKELAQVASQMGTPGVAERVAELVLSLMAKQ
ncbi:MAG: lipid-A-disaccharide synthase [Deltaproteobacteria bacterium]|nr:lipid-A-disaccharide synthase [Deltaproteobacteria bacterium]MBN2671142.1 lipid-A-disaccharide synthase [Deltaproteobacteria bacterium]